MKSSGGFKLDGSNFRLYRPRGGALILHKDLSLNGKTVPWTLHGKDPHNPYTLLWQLTNLDYFITINHIHACIITHGFNHVLFHLFIYFLCNLL